MLGREEDLQRFPGRLVDDVEWIWAQDTSVSEVWCRAPRKFHAVTFD